MRHTTIKPIYDPMKLNNKYTTLIKGQTLEAYIWKNKIPIIINITSTPLVCIIKHTILKKIHENLSNLS
jgi:hypothetical protein